MKTVLLIASGMFVAVLATASIPAPAYALTAKECSAKYQAAKAAGTLNGMKWNDFRKAECGGEAPAPNSAASSRETGRAAPGRRRRGEEAGDRRTCCDDRARARLRRRVEGRKGGRNEAPRNEVAAILERLRQAQEGRGDVTARGAVASTRHSGARALAREPLIHNRCRKSCPSPGTVNLRVTDSGLGLRATRNDGRWWAVQGLNL